MVLDWQGQNEKRKTYIGHLKYWSYKLREIEIEIDENDKISDLIWHKLYTINVESFITNTLPIQSQLNIYTDGSKIKAHVGVGFVFICFYLVLGEFFLDSLQVVFVCHSTFQWLYITFHSSCLKWL